MEKILKDKFGNRVYLGDKVVYAAANGLRVGVVSKFNPRTFKIKLYSNSSTAEDYINIPYSYNGALASYNALSQFSAELLFNENEKESLRINKLERGVA